MDTSPKASRWKLLFKIVAVAIIAFFLFAFIRYAMEPVEDPDYQPVDRSAVEEDPGNVYPLGDAAVTSYLDTLPPYTGNNPEGIMLATYAVGSGGNITLSQKGNNSTYTKEIQNIDEHRFLWDFYKDIFGDVKEFSYIEKYIINTDGIENLLAAVRLDETNVWELYVDPMDTLKEGKIFDEQDFVYTLVHEFAHVMTLNASQTDHTVYYEDECDTILIDEGCVYDDSYYYQYFKTFWQGDFYDEWQDLVDGQSEDNAYFFYDTYPDNFLTAYSATAPVEDIAEAFAHFILRDEGMKADQTVATSKQDFFYQFPILVEVRDEIRNNIEALDPKFFTRPLIIK